MQAESAPVQRRQHKRYKVEGGTVGVARFRFTKMGQIHDISKGGLSFRYVDSGDLQDQIPDVSELSISLADNSVHMDAVPFVTRSDFKVKPDFLEMRQRCVQFGQMSSSQAIHLEFILTHLASK